MISYPLVAAGSGAQTGASNSFTQDQNFGANVRMHGPDPWYDVTHPTFGAKGDGTTDDTAAIQAAINAAKVNGGVVWFPPNTYNYTSLNLDQTTGVVLRGAATQTAGAAAASILRCTATGSGTAISARSSSGFTMQNLMCQYNNAGFTGLLVDLGHVVATDSGYATIEYCYFGGTGGANGCSVLISLDKVVQAKLRKLTFGACQVAVRGQAAAGSYSQNVSIIDCANVVGNVVAAVVKNAAQGWLIEGCNFEALSGNAAGSYLNDNGVVTSNLTFKSCWFGDVSNGGTHINLAAAGAGNLGVLNVEGCYLGGDVNATAISVPNNCWVSVVGNVLQTFNVGLSIGTSTGVIWASNEEASVSTRISGTPNNGVVQAGSGNVSLYGGVVVPSGGVNIQGGGLTVGAGGITASGGIVLNSGGLAVNAGAVFAMQFVSNLTGGGRISQGSGAPGLPNGLNPTAGDIWFRTDTPSTVNQRIYICTVGGGTPTWVGIV